MPQFSMVIPVYNRQGEIRRALKSCLGQERADFEVIVVDDGSTDGTAAAAESCGDPRVRLLRHTANRGQGAARNTGIAAASGEWIIGLDSDDELLPGALALIAEKVRTAGAEVERLAFMLERDDGRVSPLPESRDEVLDHSGYLAWLEGRTLYDFLSCTKRFTFDAVRWEEHRWTDHCLYHLDFAARYRTLFCSDRVARVHISPAGLSRKRRDAGNAVLSAVELGEEMDLILARHGQALQQFAPRTREMYQRMRAAYYFLAGARREGFQQLKACLRAAPFSADVWLMLVLGLTSPRLFARVRSWRPPAT